MDARPHPPDKGAPWPPSRPRPRLALHRRGLGPVHRFRHHRRDRLDHRSRSWARSPRGPSRTSTGRWPPPRAAFPAWSATPGRGADRVPDQRWPRRSAPAWSPGRPHHPRGGDAAGALPARPSRPAAATRSPPPPRWPPTSPGSRRWATRSSCASRSAWSAASPRGTTRSTRSRPRWPRHWPPAAPWCVKPSEVAPLNAFVLAEIFDEVGLPAGVFNLVTGFGPVVGEAIAAHPDVDMVSFTGSTRAGKRVVRGGRGHRQAGGARAGRQVGQRDPRRRRPGRGRPRRRGQVLPQLGSDLQRPDPDARAPGPAGRGRGAGPHHGRVLHPGRSRSTAATRLGPLVSAAQRDRVRDVHRQGHRRGRHAGDRRGGGTRRPRHRLLRRPDRVLRR